VKAVVGDQCFDKIYPFVLALKGLEEGIRHFSGNTEATVDDDTATSQGATLY
jgi:hypothetical protein